MDPIPSHQSLIKSRPYIGLAQSKVMLLLAFKEGHPSSRPEGGWWGVLHDISSWSPGKLSLSEECCG